MAKKDNTLLIMVGLGAAVFFLATRKPDGGAVTPTLTDAQKKAAKVKLRAM